MKLNINEAIEEEFEIAKSLDDTSQEELTEQEQFFAKGQVEAGYEVRFDKIKIFSRDKNSARVVSILRTNLKINPGLKPLHDLT